MAESERMYDVAIIGGGPGGSTCGTLIRKYDPSVRVLILEKERFPRDHIGESQLPPIGGILHEMGAWDKIEAAGFPVKLGATYTWGRTVDPWVFSFIPVEEIGMEPRPGRYDGWRRKVAFQVDRALYDDILLNHAAEMGCEVRQGTRVAKVHHTNGRVTGLELESGERIEARWYVDASGNAAILRRSLGVQVNAPTLLRNVAFWEYWSAPGLNEPIFEGGATRVHIRSVPWGWLWYIALSMDRTSVGLVCPAEYYKSCGKRPEDLYHESIRAEKSIAGFLARATPRGRVDSTTDWSYIAERTSGDNWFLCGECLGFADPILAAGLTLTHTCARHLAFTLLELIRGSHDPNWLREQYHEIQCRRVVQHMKFAEYWYSANGQFSDIQENCSKIARESGLKLNPAEAFRWLSNGGIDDHLGQFALGGHDLASFRQVQMRFRHERDQDIRYTIDGKNVFKLNLLGAERTELSEPHEGRIVRIPAYRRGGHTLPIVGGYGIAIEALKRTSDGHRFVEAARDLIASRYQGDAAEFAYTHVIQCLEVMASNGWVACSLRKGRPTLNVASPREGRLIYTAKTAKESMASAGDDAPAAAGGRP